MLTPKTYKGYDSDGKCVIEYTAVDANDYINPAEVQAGIDKVKAAFTEQMKEVGDKLRAITADASEAIIVQGTKMDEVIEDTADALDKVPAQIYDSISGLYTEAEAAHDKIQTAANEEARNAAASYTGVVRVS